MQNTLIANPKDIIVLFDNYEICQRLKPTIRQMSDELKILKNMRPKVSLPQSTL
jgi:hypothetical protein